ncbi:hypothetical protein [Maricaulis sp.]|uniref:hypothetical protein n=1 Tax=Maricaulis sp. TaxID=1486257 RepID=UPI003A904E77
MRCWMGVDINGWHDYAVRDWGVEESEPIAPVEIDGGVFSVAVRREGREGEWIGGPQAALAPHGRGDDWGEIGKSGKRVNIRDVLDDWFGAGASSNAEDTSQPLVAAFDAVARNAERLMVVIPDHAGIGEAVQGRILRTLNTGRRPRSQLLWRSVALFHGAVGEGLIPRRQVGMTVRVLSHVGGGLEEQTMTLVAAKGFADHLAPERLGYGRLLAPEIGLDALLETSRAQVFAANPELSENRCEPSQLPVRRLLSSCDPAEVEILRRHNDTWMEVVAPKVEPETLLPDGLKGLEFGEVDLTVLTTPLMGDLAERLRCCLSKSVGNIHLLPTSAIARGALDSARIIESGKPHYVERLEPIALAVLRDSEPVFDHLIPPGSNVPANKEYVSPPMRGFRWGRHTERIEFYVAKGDVESNAEVRSWSVEGRNAPDVDMPVTLQLRQMPGQSWARLTVTADDSAVLSAPVELDWETLQIDKRAPSEILKELTVSRPVVPNRVVEPADRGFWDGEYVEPGLFAALEMGPDAIYDALKRQWRVGGAALPSRAISTDGELPRNLPPAWEEALISTREALAEDLLGPLRRDESPATNRELLALTWMFTLCPDDVQDVVLDAYQAAERGEDHPLLGFRGISTVLQQGAGRTVSSPERVKRLLGLIRGRAEWNSHTRGSLSFLLSRRANAPDALDFVVVRDLALRLNQHLHTLNAERSFETDFKYTIMSIVGLLRYREIEPFALVAGKSAEADAIYATLERTRKVMEPSISLIRQGDRKLQVVISILEMLAGDGGDPDILQVINDLG